MSFASKSDMTLASEGGDSVGLESHIVVTVENGIVTVNILPAITAEPVKLAVMRNAELSVPSTGLDEAAV